MWAHTATYRNISNHVEGIALHPELQVYLSTFPHNLREAIEEEADAFIYMALKFNKGRGGIEIRNLPSETSVNASILFGKQIVDSLISVAGCFVPVGLILGPQQVIHQAWYQIFTFVKCVPCPYIGRMASGSSIEYWFGAILTIRPSSGQGKHISFAS